MNEFSISGRSAATAATANHVGAQLWNPHATRSLYVVSVSFAKTVATADFLAFKITTARGTASSSLTSNSSADLDGDVAPITGAILDLTFSAQPTLQASSHPRLAWNDPAAVSSGAMKYMFSNRADGIRVGPGQGLAIYTPVATILQPRDVTYDWME